MPIVEFPYTKKGEVDARKAAKMHDGRYIADKKAGKKGGNQLDDVAHAAAFLVKTEFGSGAKNDFIKTFKKWL